MPPAFGTQAEDEFLVTLLQQALAGEPSSHGKSAQPLLATLEPGDLPRIARMLGRLQQSLQTEDRPLEAAPPAPLLDSARAIGLLKAGQAPDGLVPIRTLR